MPAPAEEEAGALQSLLASMVERDQGALDRLYALTVPRVYSVAYRILRNPADAEEVVVDTFQQAWDHAAEYRPERGGVVSWLLVIAWTRAIDRRRRVRSRGIHLQQALRPDDTESAYTNQVDDPTDQMLDTLITGTAIHAALAELPPAQRRSIALAFLEGMSHVEIATATGLPLGTIKSHIRRGLARMQEALASFRPRHE